jgi:hypothetical protein
MKNTLTYTSTLPKEIIQLTDYYARKLKIPKNKIIENALTAYFEKLKKAEYVQSFMKANNNVEMKDMAEEGLEDYLKLIEE